MNKLYIFAPKNEYIMDINSLTALKIRSVRKEKGFSQIDIAQKIGLSQSAYGRIENAEVNIILNDLEKISQALECPINELLQQKSNVQNLENSRALQLGQDNNQFSLTINVSSKEDLDKIIEVINKY